MEQISDELAQVRVVGLLLEAERAAVVQVGRELGGLALAELLHRGRQLLLADLLVLLGLGLGLQPLPRQLAYLKSTIQLMPPCLHCIYVNDSSVPCRKYMKM